MEPGASHPYPAQNRDSDIHLKTSRRFPPLIVDAQEGNWAGPQGFLSKQQSGLSTLHSRVICGSELDEQSVKDSRAILPAYHRNNRSRLKEVRLFPLYQPAG